MYHIYHTEAIILSGRSAGEGDRLLSCYTRDLGLINAHAKSVRLQRSRLRYALQTFAHAQVDLVQGKRGWRLVSARPITLFPELWKHRQKRAIAAHQGELLKRLIQGEEPHPVLFSDMLKGLSFLHVAEDHLLGSLEVLFVVRLLAKLGYWGGEERYKPLTSGNEWGSEVLGSVKGMHSELLYKVNEALRATQL